MKEFEWNDSLAAYDKQYDVLEAVRDELEEFIDEVLGEVSRCVAQASKEQFVLTECESEEDEEDEEEVGLGQTSFNTDPSKLGGLYVQIWPTAPNGGPAGLMRVALHLKNSIVEEESMPDDIADVIKKLLPVFKGLPGVPGSELMDVDMEDESGPCLWVKSFECSSPNLVKSMVETTLTYCKAADDAVETLQSLRGSTPYLWVRGVLQDLLDSGVMKEVSKARAGWTAPHLKMPWLSGKYLDASAGDEGGFWIGTIPPGGKLLFAFGKKRSGSSKFQKHICDAAEARPGEFDNYLGGELFNNQEIGALFQEENKEAIKSKVMTAWRAFLNFDSGQPTTIANPEGEGDDIGGQEERVNKI